MLVINLFIASTVIFLFIKMRVRNSKVEKSSLFLFKPSILWNTDNLQVSGVKCQYITLLGPVQTSNFTCAESNANEQEQ